MKRKDITYVFEFHNSTGVVVPGEVGASDKWKIPLSNGDAESWNTSGMTASELVEMSRARLHNLARRKFELGTMSNKGAICLKHMNQGTGCLNRSEGVLCVEGRSLRDNIKIESGRRVVVQRQSGSARSIVARLSQTARVGTADGGSSTPLRSCIWAHESRDCLGRDTLRNTRAERVVTSGKPIMLHRNTGLNSPRRSKLGRRRNRRGECIGSAIRESGEFIDGGRHGKRLTNLV